MSMMEIKIVILGIMLGVVGFALGIAYERAKNLKTLDKLIAKYEHMSLPKL